MKRSIRKTLTKASLGLAVAVALFFMLSHGTGEATPTVANAPARTEHTPPAANTSPEEQRAASEAHSDVGSWNSDGGYWYYLDRQGPGGNSH